MTDHLTIVTHPLVQHKLSIMRDKETSTSKFPSCCARFRCCWPMR